MSSDVRRDIATCFVSASQSTIVWLGLTLERFRFNHAEGVQWEKLEAFGKDELVDQLQSVPTARCCLL